VYGYTGTLVHDEHTVNRPISIYRLGEMLQSCGQCVSAPHEKAVARLNAYTELRTKRQRSAQQAMYRNRPTQIERMWGVCTKRDGWTDLDRVQAVEAKVGGEAGSGSDLRHGERKTCSVRCLLLAGAGDLYIHLTRVDKCPFVKIRVT
jgi:hypothetical protein